MRRFITKALVAGAAIVSLLAFTVPGTAPAPSAAMEKNALTYFYEGGQQTGLTETTAAALMDPETPYVATADFHSLGEIAVQSTNELNIVEVGWNVDPGLYGDSNSHLFVHAWVNGVPKGYNAAAGSGWVDYTGNALNAGAAIPTADLGVAKTFAISHTGGAWWVQYDASWIGWFPDTLWSGNSPSITFTSFQIFQGFGEVAANSAAPCTDMGKGTLATTVPAGAKVSSVQYSSGTTGVNLSQLGSFGTTNYNSYKLTSNRTVYYGGPGSC